MDNKYIARPCKNCKMNDCCFKGHENNFEICEDYTVTNGDVIKAMIPNIEVKPRIEYGINMGVRVIVYMEEHSVFELWFPTKWWNAPYKKESEEEYGLLIKKKPLMRL